MKNYLLPFICFFLWSGYGQQLPQITTKTEENVKLTHLEIKVDVIGNYATTVFDMKFYNPNDRILEGELSFPLGDGQSVARFSMDVNGKMRDAIVVEKELARVAYESTIRQKIDPALLEKTEGNNYKARIYPILPKQYKHILITVEEELKSSNGNKYYNLPLGFKGDLDSFRLSVEAYTNQLPIVVSPKIKEEFAGEKNFYQLNFSGPEYATKEVIKILIPEKEKGYTLLTEDGVFYYYQNIQPQSRLKPKPKRITILWDVSYSMKLRNLQKEIKLLKGYVDYLKNVEVQFISFSSQIQKKQTLKLTNGDAEPLIDLINTSTYDGGTALTCFEEKDLKADEILLFSDGLSNLGLLDFKRRPVYAINSLIKSNSEYLNRLSIETSGNYMNLNLQSDAESLNKLKLETYQFLGVKHKSSIFQVYPRQKENVSGDFSISGKFNQNAELTLLFGFNGKVSEKKKVNIGTTEQNAEHVKRLWARKKLQGLIRSEEEPKVISNFAERYQLVSNYTSMIILDRVEDYARYKIEPPKELLAEYKSLVKEYELAEEELKEDLEYRKDNLVLDYEAILEWYTTSYDKKPKEHKKKQTNVDQNHNRVNQANTNVGGNLRISGTRPEHVDSSKRTIYGRITDEDGQPVPGVDVIVKGTEYGTVTNFDGEYILNAEAGNYLIFSYVGFDTLQLEVDDSNDTLNASLNENTARLDEVVVTTYQGILKESEVVSASSVVESQAIAQPPPASIGDVLQGQVAGTNIQTATGQTEMNENREVNPAQDNTLYVINGVTSSKSEFEKLQRDSIQSMEVLKPSDATKIFGNRAQAGTIVVTTKSGYLNNRVEIEALEEKIAQNIELVPRYQDKPYITILEEYQNTEEAYTKYLELRDKYSNSPVFFIDVADFFESRNARETAILIVSNLIELELNNYELLKALAYKLEYFERNHLAVEVYKKVLDLRPEEPQSYRDLALAYEQVGDYQKAFDLLYKLYDGQLLEKDEEERFYGIEHIAFVELSRLLALYKNELKVSKSIVEKFPPMPVDIRVVIDWNHNDTDIDLWVIDPNEEKGYYSNALTDIGGRLSEDMLDGYGPEEYMLKQGIKGEYTILVDYFTDNVQKISGPTVLKVTIFTNYGRKNEQKRVLISYLEDGEEEIKVGNINF